LKKDGGKKMPVKPPDEAMLARMPMDRDEYQRLRPRGKFTLAKQKILNMIARVTLHRGLRIWLYRQMGINIGENCVVEMFCYLDDQFPELIFFDDHSGPSRHVVILCHDDVAAKAEGSPEALEDFEARHGFVAPVRLKSYSGIGLRSILLPGVTVGEGSMIGAGAVVNKSVPDQSLAVGIPAKVVKTFSPPNKEGG
jgi:acetyltransferase-like isoleucine patch superfamily enzyme